jgi:aspartyl-tRNA(Asn)/glutamyl-tRNA(Gln) amidotransferase subunit A
MDAVGPISRTVEDAAITLTAIAGYDPKDPYTWNSPVPDYRRALDGNIRGIRVGIIRQQLNSELTDADTREAVLRATAVLGDLGATVDEVSIPLTDHSPVLSQVPLLVEPATNHRSWVRDRLQEYGHNNRIGLLTGSIMPAQAYYKYQKLRNLFREEVHRALDSYDVLITPTAGVPAQPIVDDPVITSKENATGLRYLFTRIFNLANAPAISVPCGFSSDGLPIGLQIGGRPDADETLLKVAHAYEQSTNWHTMKPPHA